MSSHHNGHNHHHHHHHHHSEGMPHFHFSHYVPLDEYYELVEKAISNFGLDAKKARTGEKGSWILMKNGIPLWIDVFQVEGQDWGSFQCMAPAFELPQDKELRCKIYQELLEKAHTIFGVAITKFRSWIYVKVIREVHNITVEEIMNIIVRVGNYAVELNRLYGSSEHKNLEGEFG